MFIFLQNHASVVKRRSRKSRKSHKGRIATLIASVLILVIAIAIYQLAFSPKSSSEPPKSSQEPNKVLLKTSMGDITIQLYDDMPITTGNFKNLTKHGVYDATIFHRVVHNFVIQGGDASAKGISVATIRDELPNKHSNIRGSVAMAKTSEPNSATSQFYINLKDNLNLDSNYSVFGTVIAGMDVVDAIGKAQTDSNDRPLQDVTIIKAEIIS